ncbi:N-alpha-acetyltransferase 40 [Cytospora mali]|uniref:N-alpha-acetyltransferase 40 n=1 Tax=Cytospora mali TaxID=578113 RepID=A0A194UW32_CYTMA|nr:N-alpha-acetyltransferase 40 [Valsa mali var. pyri (nom. inval.)]
MSKRSRLQQIEEAIDVVNRKTDTAFAHEYLTNSPVWTYDWIHPNTAASYKLGLFSPRQTLTDPDLETCFALVEETSKQDYENSSRGWNPSAKRKEMRDPDLRYILVRDASSQIQGFTSLMPTLEEGQPVVYCYEIHLKPALRGTGLSRLLISMLESVAAEIEVMEKVMLTVFTCNERAMQFYRRCGFERDEISPRPRRLRGGKVKLPDYEILSKRAKPRQGGTEHSGAAHGDVPGTGAQNGDYKTGHKEKTATAEESRPAKMARIDHDEPTEDGWETDEG